MPNTVDYLIYELEDCLLTGKKSDPIPGSRLVLDTVHHKDLPEALVMPSRKGRFKLRKEIWDDQGKIYLINTSTLTKKSMLRSGIRLDNENPYIDINDRVFVEGLIYYLPTMQRANLIADAVPATSWGASLHRMLMPAQWATMRSATIDRCNGRCEICGSAGADECHEQWEYHEPAARNGSNWGVQQLRGLTNLCSRCHLAHHLGFAQRQDKLGETLDYIRGINQWDKEQVEQYATYIQTSWRRRSDFGWLLDVTTISSEEPFRLGTAWQSDKGGFIKATTPYGIVTTKLLGTKWLSCDDIRLTKIDVQVLGGLSEPNNNPCRF